MTLSLLEQQWWSKFHTSSRPMAGPARSCGCGGSRWQRPCLPPISWEAIAFASSAGYETPARRPEKRILQLCHEGPGAIIGGTITVGFLAALCQRMHRCQIPLWALWGSFLAMDKMATNSSILMKDILYDVWIGFGPLRIRDHTILK